MVTVTYQPPFVRKEDLALKNPLRCRIQRVEIVDRKEGPDLQIFFEDVETLSFTARISAWGMNKKRLIDALGQETDMWLGAIFDLYGEQNKDGQYIKRIENVRKA